VLSSEPRQGLTFARLFGTAVMLAAAARSSVDHRHDIRRRAGTSGWAGGMSRQPIATAGVGMNGVRIRNMFMEGVVIVLIRPIRSASTGARSLRAGGEQAGPEEDPAVATDRSNRRNSQA